MPLLPGPSGARDKRRRPPVAEDLAVVADTASVESDHSSDADADRIVMGDEGIGYESSGYSSGESQLEFRGCESKSGSEADAPASVSDGGGKSGSDSDSSDDPELLCFLCTGPVEQKQDTEFEGVCDGCGRVLPMEEVTFTCSRGCDFDICLPCADRHLSTNRSTPAGNDTPAGDDIPLNVSTLNVSARAPSAVQQQLTSTNSD